MPTRPKHPCAVPWCVELTLGRYCAAHVGLALVERRAKEDRRGGATSRGYDGRWRKARRRYLAAHPLCVDPFGHHPGVVAAATQVDHVIPHKGNRVLFWDVENWQALCAHCGSFKSAIEEGGVAHEAQRQRASVGAVDGGGRVQHAGSAA